MTGAIWEVPDKPQVWMSPNQMMDLARSTMLDGREPETTDDYLAVATCIAGHLAPDICINALLTLRIMYRWPLPVEVVEKVGKLMIAEHNRR